MEKPKKVKTEDIFSEDVFTLDTHKFAEMNPMNSAEDFLALKHSISLIGQQDPITLFKGRVVDGRNRCKALKELYNETKDSNFKYVKFKKLSTTLSNSELEELVIGKETRRHKTNVQKAIQAMNYYAIKKGTDNAVNMIHAAKKFGTTQGSVSKILALQKVAGETVVQKLFNGDKIKISKAKRDGSTYYIESTSPDAIRKYYENLLVTSSDPTEVLEAQEIAYIQLETTKLIDMLSCSGVKYLMKSLENNMDSYKTSYKKEVIEKELGLNPKTTDKYADKKKRDRIVQSLTKYIKEGRYEFEDYEIQSQPDIVIKEIKELLKT